jgi:hypothetical protein
MKANEKCFFIQHIFSLVHYIQGYSTQKYVVTACMSSDVVPSGVSDVTRNPPHTNKSITITSVSEYKQYAACASSSTFVNCHIVAPSCDETERKPIDLVVVLDRSGSMEGEKLDLCKKTMDFFARELSVHDRVALVSYDSYVTMDLRLTKMSPEGKAKLANSVHAICAGFCTNLSGGLLAGIEEIQQLTRPYDEGPPNPVQSVLILTDGLANEGITTCEGLINMVENILHPHVSVFTFGYGSDHNADLLRQIADLGRGSYYFVQNVDGVSLAFADCLGGLLSVVAQNIKVEVIAVPAPSSACSSSSSSSSIMSIKSKRPMTIISPSAHVEIDLGDMYADEVRDILVQVRLTSMTHDADTADVPIIEFRVRYDNLLTSSFDHQSSAVSVQRPVVVAMDQPVDASIVQQKHRIVTAEAMAVAQEKAKKGLLSEARDVLASVTAQLRKEIASFNNDDDNDDHEVQSGGVCASAMYYVADLEACMNDMQTDALWRTCGHGRMAQKLQSHMAKRSNDVEVQEDKLYPSADFSTVSSHGGYRNISKANMMKKAFVEMQSSSYPDVACSRHEIANQEEKAGQRIATSSSSNVVPSAVAVPNRNTNIFMANIMPPLAPSNVLLSDFAKPKEQGEYEQNCL